MNECVKVLICVCECFGKLAMTVSQHLFPWGGGHMYQCDDSTWLQTPLPQSCLSVSVRGPHLNTSWNTHTHTHTVTPPPNKTPSKSISNSQHSRVGTPPPTPCNGCTGPESLSAATCEPLSLIKTGFSWGYSTSWSEACNFTMQNYNISCKMWKIILLLSIILVKSVWQLIRPFDEWTLRDSYQLSKMVKWQIYLYRITFPHFTTFHEGPKPLVSGLLLQSTNMLHWLIGDSKGSLRCAYESVWVCGPATNCRPVQSVSHLWPTVTWTGSSNHMIPKGI